MSLKKSLLRAILPPFILSTVLTLVFTLFHQLTLLCYIVSAYAMLLVIAMAFRTLTIGKSMREARKKREDTSSYIYVAALFSSIVIIFSNISNLISLPDKIENSHSPIFFSIAFTFQADLTLILGLPAEIIFTLIFLGRAKLITRYLAFFGIPTSTAEPSDTKEALQPGRDQL